jgi:hypothetical protein
MIKALIACSVILLGALFSCSKPTICCSPFEELRTQLQQDIAAMQDIMPHSVKAENFKSYRAAIDFATNQKSQFGLVLN